MQRFYIRLITFSFILFLSAFAFAQTPSIGILVSPSSFCAGDTMTIIFVTSSDFDSDNLFTVELSNDSGSFAHADTIDTLSGISGDTVYYVVPVLPASSLYAVRVLGSDPAVTGAPTISPITIRQQLPPPNIQLSPAGSVINTCKGDSVNFKFSSDSNLVFVWKFNDSLFTNPHNYYLTDKDSGTFIIQYTDTALAGCSIGYDTVLLAVHAYPAKPSVTASGPVNICGTGTVKLTTTNNPNLTYQWLDINNAVTDTLSGSTSTTYTASATGLYNVLAYNSVCATASSGIQVNIDTNPVVSFVLALDSFCLYSPPILLLGGEPVGGSYSSALDYVNGSLFEQSLSGLGTFTVYYTYSNSIGCHGTDSAQLSIFDCTTSGIENIENAFNLNMYPNPTSGSVTITTGDNAVKQTRIINLMGQEISRQTFTQQLIYNCSILPAGTYLVEVTDTANNWKSVQRLVVQ